MYLLWYLLIGLAAGWIANLIARGNGAGFIINLMVGIIGGVLQFEVLEHRLKTEYQVDIVMESMPFRYVRWVVNTPKEVDKLKLTSTSGRAKDSRERDVLLFENEWSIRLACENNEGLELAETANRL